MCLWSVNTAENTAQHLLNSPLVLLDPKEDVQLQPPMMEPDSGVNAGNYCVVCKLQQWRIQGGFIGFHGTPLL